MHLCGLFSLRHGHSATITDSGARTCAVFPVCLVTDLPMWSFIEGYKKSEPLFLPDAAAAVADTGISGRECEAQEEACG